MARRGIVRSVAVLFALTVSSSLAAEPDIILVGCPMPAQASYGINGIRGLTLAAEEINAAGGVMLNSRKHKLKLEFVDTGDLTPKTTEAEAMAKVEYLITEKKVDVLVGGPNRSEYGVAAMDVVAKHNIVHIASSGCYTPMWNEVRFASDPKKYRKSFRMSGNIKWYISETKDLLNSMKKKYGFKKMFILIQDALMCHDAAKSVKEVMEKEGWQIVGLEANPSDTTDFSENLKKCKASGANVLFLWNYSPNTSYLFEQWRNMEIPALPVGYVEVAEDPGFWEKTKGKCAYSVITLSEAGTTLSDVTPGCRRYFNAYKKRWGVEPRGTSSVASYEALYVLKDAVERANSLKPGALVPALEKTDLPVVRGQLRFDKNHQCVFGYDPKTSVLGNWAQWQDGKRVSVWPEATKTADLKMPPWMQWFWLKTRTKIP